MNREQLSHVLRAACQVAEDPEILVIGSQSILGSYWEDELPADVVFSMEADLAFFDDPDETKSNRVDGAIGELSSFHEMYAYYGQGVSLTTAVLPQGWRQRLVKYENLSTGTAHAVCLEPHDCVASKLVAGREKDVSFAVALIQSHLIDIPVLRARSETLPVTVRSRVLRWIDGYRPATHDVG